MFSWFGLVNYCPATKVADFAALLRDGILTASHCTSCGCLSFPPRADCPACGHEKFTLEEISGRGRLITYTRIEAAPAGFQELVPYTLGVVELEEGGRLLAPCGETIKEQDISIGLAVQVVPRLCEECEDIKVHYTLERPGTTWVRTGDD